MKRIINILIVAASMMIATSNSYAQQTLWGAYPDAFYNSGTFAVTSKYQEVFKNVNLGQRATSIFVSPENTLYGTTINSSIYRYVPGDLQPSLVFHSDEMTFSIAHIDFEAGYIYGNGFSSGHSNIFRLNLDGTDLTILRGNDGTGHGAYSLQKILNNKIYGLRNPSPQGYQIYFTMNLDGSAYTELRNFPDVSERPTQLHWEHGRGQMWVLSRYGGTCGKGAVFSLALDGTEYYKIHDFRGTNYDCGGTNPPDEDLSFEISDGEEPINIISGPEETATVYVITQGGGSFESGKLIGLGWDGLHEMMSFSYGTRPNGPLAIHPDGRLLGLCGVRDDFSGKIFSHDPQTQLGHEFDILIDFETPPHLASVVNDIQVGSDGRIYGISERSSFLSLLSGTIFSLDGDGTDLQRDYYFGVGLNPLAIAYQDSTLVGMFKNSIPVDVPGETGYVAGSVFRYDYTGVTHLYTFDQLAADSARLTAGKDGYAYVINADQHFILKVKLDGSDNQKTTVPEFKSSAPLSVTASGIYGTSYGSDTYPDGFLYKVKTDFSGIDIIYTFSPATGSKPRGTVVEFNGYLYGLTSSGGSSGNGVVFRVQTNGSGYTVLHHFDGTNGGKPYGGLTPIFGIFYGMTSTGGANNLGVIFRINDDGSGFTKVYDFNSVSGGSPKGDFVLGHTTLYGITTTGAAYGYGSLFAFYSSVSPHLDRLKVFERPPLQTLALVPGQVGPLSYLLTPEDGAFGVSSNPEIEVQEIPDATQYTIELSSAEDFSCCVLTKTLTTNKGTFEGLQYETTYYARVTTNVTPSYGPLTHFTTSQSEGDAYVITPADSAEHIAISNLEVTANLVNGATSYTIELNTSADFTGTSFVETSDERTVIFNGLSNATRYYTRVRTNLSPDWGATTTFKTIGTESYVITPADNASNIGHFTTFQLQPVAGATRYFLVLDFTRSNGETGTQSVDSQTPTINFSGLAYSSVYQTRVKTDVNPNFGPVTTFSTVSPLVDTYVRTPADGATGIETTVVVYSNIVGEAQFYTIELNTSPDFTGTSFVQTSPSPYIWYLTFTGLAPSTTYYSRVKTDLSPEWGATRSFTTTNQSNVTILDPVQDETGVSVTPLIKISPIAGATLYTVQLSESPDYSGSVITLSSSDPNIRSTPLKYSRNYYARAKTNLHPGYGLTRHFSTHQADKYAFVSNPVDQATNVATNNLKVTANIVYGATMYRIELNTSQFFDGTSIVRTSNSGQRTLTFNGLAPGTRYYSRVITNLQTLYGPVRSFTTAGLPTYVVEPANNATEVSPTQTIRVAAVTGATGYTLEVSNTPDFSGAVSTYNSATTQFNNLGYLSYSTRYYMRAKAGTTGNFGQVTTFITHAAEKFSFVSSPVNGATNVGTTNVSITANIVYGATSYTIELNTSPDFTGTSIVRSSAVPNQRSIVFNALQPGTTYYNRTMTNLPSNWGPVRSFTTAGSPPSPAPEFAEENGRIKVYPNPFITTFTAEVPEGSDVKLAVFDVTGKQVIKTSTSKGQLLQLGDDLSKGVYILRIQDGVNVTIHRVIKQ